ncbi:MAG: hypothetical protein LBG61_02170 [Burkholderiales bacterium]|jgi:hypothetical protein|nr:hypothetical protein [Burkholderiales bacterium]
MKNRFFKWALAFLVLGLVSCGGGGGGDGDGSTAYIGQNGMNYPALVAAFPVFEVDDSELYFVELSRSYPLDTRDFKARLENDTTGTYECETRTDTDDTTCNINQEKIEAMGFAGSTAYIEPYGLHLSVYTSSVGSLPKITDPLLAQLYGKINVEPASIRTDFALHYSDPLPERLIAYYEQIKKQPTMECSANLSYSDGALNQRCNDARRAYCDVIRTGEPAVARRTYIMGGRDMVILVREILLITPAEVSYLLENNHITVEDVCR